MNAEQFNAAHPVGTPVVAYPGARPEDVPSARRLVTRTRSEAQPFGLDREGVVWVDGHGACIALTHIDVVSESEPITDLATAVEVMGALPMPAGPTPQPATPRWHQLRTELIRTLRDYMPETARTKAVDKLDEVIAELGGRTAGAVEYGIRIPDGDVLLDGDPTDRAEQEDRLDRCRGKALWPDAVLVQRPVFHGEWTEAK